MKVNRITHKGQRTPEGNQRGERRPTSSPWRRGQRPIVSAGTVEEAIALGTSWVAGAAPKPNAGSSDGDTAIELLERSRDPVDARVVSEANRDENWVYDGLVIFVGAADGLLCAITGDHS